MKLSTPVFFSLIFASFVVKAQQPICTYQTVTTQANMVLGDTCCADLDADGDIDAAAIGIEKKSRSLLVFLNNGDGSFSVANPIAIDVNAADIVCGNLDNDSDVDLVIGNSLSNTVSILLNNSDATFAAATDFAVTNDPMLATNELALLDIDNDTDLDLAVTSWTSDPEIEIVGTLSILINNGGGSFGTASSDNIGVCPSGMKPMDFDHDGDVDLLVATEGEDEESSPALLFMASDGSGNLTIVDEIEIRQTGNTIIETTDLDADSFLDLVLVSGSSGFSVYYGSAIGFEPESDYTFSGLARDISFMDLNGDAAQEVIIPSGIIDRVGLLLNNGTRNFTQLEYASVGLDATAIMKGDFDGDANEEFLVVHSESMTLVTLSFNCEEPDNQCIVSAKPIVELNEPRGVFVADVNGDSFLDLMTTFDEASLAVQLNDGTGSFNAPNIFDTDCVPERMACGDIDGDNDLDIVVENTSISNSISVLTNDGSGNFFDRTDIPLFAPGITSPTDVQLADLDSDSDLDLIVCLSGLTDDSSAFIFENQNGQFVFGNIIPVAGFSNSFGVADFDDDGDLDMVFNNVFSEPAIVSVFFNNGNGFFSAPSTFETDGSPSAPAESSGSGVLSVADYNNDSIMDIVVTDRADDFLSTMLGRGDGTFDPPIRSEHLVYSAIISMESLDIDDDGDLDLVLANGFPNNVILALNDGHGNFEFDFSEYLGQRPFDIAAADANIDGIFEFYISHSESNQVVSAVYSCDNFLLGDVNLDGIVSLLDVAPFVNLLITGQFQVEADINSDGAVDLLDVAGFVDLLVSG